MIRNFLMLIKVYIREEITIMEGNALIIVDENSKDARIASYISNSLIRLGYQPYFLHKK